MSTQNMALAAMALAAAKVDRLAAVLVAFRLAWLTLATYVGIWLAYYNPDPLFRQAFGP